ncbi:chloride transporter, chloride channel (ClC) family protein [Klebsiella variicola]|nr:chloride transporter, chloride channel (ClC) family protein [Klebsiella variicola]VAR93191.1 chloride transporter, chloride channel (ClC) family protein [Klebsiella variicola]
MAGPVLGVAAWMFRKATGAARVRVKNNWQMPVLCLLAFALLATLSLYYPQLPGNGKGPMQMAINDELNYQHATILLGLKLIVILTVLRGGAEDGLLTPGLTIGGLFSLIVQPHIVHDMAVCLPRRRCHEFCAGWRGGVSGCLPADASDCRGSRYGVNPNDAGYVTAVHPMLHRDRIAAVFRAAYPR